MKLVFLLMVYIGPTPGNPDGQMVDTTGQYFADIRKCNGYAERIAWVAMSAMVLYGLLPLFPFVSEARLGTLADLGNILMLSCAGIVAAHFGATAMMAKK